jgi:O-antigen/teichoic acid export membrane protein
MSSKAKILMRGSLLRNVEFFGRFAVNLILTPLILHSLGDKMYGLWAIVGTFIGYYGLMDLGLDLAINRFISRTVGVEDHEETNKVINTALFVFTFIGLIVLFVSIAVAYIIPHVIKNITDADIFTKVILILGSNIAIGFPLRVFAGVLTSNIRYDLNTIIEFVKLAFRTALIIFFLKHGYGLVALAVITSIIDIGGYLSRYFLVMHLYKYIVISMHYVRRSIIKVLFSYSAYVFISRLANQLRYNMDNLVIISFIGLTSVTMYSIGSRFIVSLIECVSASVGILLPVFSQYEAKKRNDLLTEKFLLTTKISSYLTIFLTGLLIIFGRAFIERWVGKEYIYSYKILVVLLIGVVFNLMNTPAVQLLYGISKHKFLAVLNLWEGVVNLVLSIILLKFAGIMGVALGTSIPMLIMSFFVLPIYTCKVIKLSMRKYYLEVMLPIIAKSSGFFIVLWLSFNSFIIPDYTNLMILGSLVGVLFVIFAFFLGFSAVERSYFIKIIISFWQKKEAVTFQSGQ